MIYRKNANFSYPILSNISTNYKDNLFKFDVTLEETTDMYRFNFTYEIGSDFILNLIKEGYATLIFIIQTKDNKFFELEYNQSFIDISKSRLALRDKRTHIQLHIQSKKQISFKYNTDLNSFYDEFKDEITIPPYSLLGFSNIEILEGRMQNPLHLFDKKLNENLNSDIKIELGSETIIINYKKEDFQFRGISNKAFNNPYIYMGLRAGLSRFIEIYSDDGMDSVDLINLPEPDNALDLKLYQLMRTKTVTELSMDNIDEVIFKISDKIIEKYANAVKEIVANGA